MVIEVLLAAKERPLGGAFEGIGPLGATPRWGTTIGEVMNVFNKLISNIIAVLTIAASLWFILQFILGAWAWLTAGADKTALENAQKKLTNSVIGLVIVIAAIFLIDLIGRILGLEILSPGKVIKDIWGPR